MKPINILVIAMVLPVLAIAQEFDFDSIKYGTPIDLPEESEDESPREETELDIEIAAFRSEHKAHNAVLISNSAGRALNDDGRLIGSEALGRLVNPMPVIIISEAMVADPVVELYTSIKKLPECAHTVRILYTESDDRSEAALLGYTIENPKGVNTKLVKYDGETEWLTWINESFRKDDAEQYGAEQPATAPESKPEGEQKPEPESEGRSQ